MSTDEKSMKQFEKSHTPNEPILKRIRKWENREFAMHTMRKSLDGGKSIPN